MENTVSREIRKKRVGRDEPETNKRFQLDITIRSIATAEMTAGPDMKKRLASWAP
ncbi:MAG: hypothetical protein GXP32_04825 [Kiritimatiellaeota bacterium]|nr:hypothetical protein [Kiritimatiellota bacterium]